MINKVITKNVIIIALNMGGCINANLRIIGTDIIGAKRPFVPNSDFRNPHLIGFFYKKILSTTCQKAFFHAGRSDTIFK